MPNFLFFGKNSSWNFSYVPFFFSCFIAARNISISSLSSKSVCSEVISFISGLRKMPISLKASERNILQSGLITYWTFLKLEFSKFCIKLSIDMNRFFTMQHVLRTNASAKFPKITSGNVVSINITPFGFSTRWASQRAFCS